MLFYFEQLSEKEKKVYERILESYQNMDESSNLEEFEVSIQDAIRIAEAVAADHPEIFWISNEHEYSSITKDGQKFVHSFFTKYWMTPKERVIRQRELEEKTRDFFKGFSSFMTEYEKAKFLYEKTAFLITYDHEGLEQEKAGEQSFELEKQKYSLYGAIVKRCAVCAGYAKAYQYLMNRVGLYSVYLLGDCEDGERHAWNLIRLEGDYYHVDTTWASRDNVYSGLYVFYGYFCLKDEEIKKSRTISSQGVPACTSDRCNYFARQNLLFHTWNRESLEACIKWRFLHDPDRKVQLRFANGELLQKAMEDLFTQGRIYRILEEAEIPCKTIWKCEEEKTSVLTIWREKPDGHTENSFL